MENHTNYWAWACLFLLGFALCYLAFPQTITKEVKGDTIYQDKVVNVSVPTDPLANAKTEFWNEFSSDSDYWTCDGDEYDIDDISISQYKDSSTEISDDESTYNFDVRLRFDEDDEKSCFDTIEVEVFYQEHEAPEVTIN